MGLTVVDSLDTLLILELKEEFAEARHWVANHLDFEQNRGVSVRGFSPGAMTRIPSLEEGLWQIVSEHYCSTGKFRYGLFYHSFYICPPADV